MMSIELTIKSAPYEAKNFNKYVMYFFRLYYHHYTTNPLQGDILRPPPHFQKGKEKIMQLQRQAPSVIFSGNWHQIRSIMPFETIMFYMDVVDQIFKNAFANRNSKHHFDVQR